MLHGHSSPVSLPSETGAATSPVKLAPALAHKAASSATKAGEKSASFQFFGRSWVRYPAPKDIRGIAWDPQVTMVVTPN